MPIKRELSTSPTPPSTPPTPANSSKTGKSATTPKSKGKPRSSVTPSPKKRAVGDSPKKMGAWSGDELKALYNIMCPKRTGVEWEDVAAQIAGRDVKACMNKWARMQNKIQQAVEALGE
ncbi:hypothetical protein EHS25_006025 [Saitozyma podzolica]|uniref:Myb-like domain-containing protein n=1 Tax=Saitozyma podzolica TaxID=1890683 RepID=A0A427XU95_9TREE|nr:hypothetical protein EHS25_006025 [Saitozyma podzolica]